MCLACDWTSKHSEHVDPVRINNDHTDNSRREAETSRAARHAVGCFYIINQFMLQSEQTDHMILQPGVINYLLYQLNVITYDKQNRTKPNRTKQNQTEQNRTEQNQTEQNQTEQNRTEPNRTEQNRTEPNRTEQNRTVHRKTLSDKTKDSFFLLSWSYRTLSCFHWRLKYNFILNSTKHVKTFLEHRNQLSDKLSQPQIINYVPFIINSQDSDARSRKHTSGRSSRPKWTLKTIKFIWRTEICVRDLMSIFIRLTCEILTSRKQQLLLFLQRWAHEWCSWVTESHVTRWQQAEFITARRGD